MLQLGSRQVRTLAPISSSFLHPNANDHKLRIYTSFDSSIEIFFIHRPGTGTHILTFSNKKIKDGMKGITPTSFSPSRTVYAAGILSLSLGSIVVMVRRRMRLGYIWTRDEEQKAVGGDVTQVCTLVLRL